MALLMLLLRGGAGAAAPGLPGAPSTSAKMTSAVPRMQARMQSSLRAEKRSPSSRTLSPKVKSEDVEDRIVLEVTFVRCSET